MAKYKLLILMGKAGSGKDTILNKLCGEYPDRFQPIISYTTRPPREGEVDGVNYHFVTPQQFKTLPSLLECLTFNNWWYASSLEGMSKDKINVGVYTPGGIRAILDNPDIDLAVWYVRADAKQRLLRQLNREEYPDVDEIIRRYSADEADFENIDDIPYTEVFNNDRAQLKGIIDLITWDNID